jgi:cyclophilin family peptidyl-prolyl cis-trans isomerase
VSEQRGKNHESRYHLHSAGFDGFAAFGHVIDGIDVVRAINALPAAGQSLDPPVLIEQVVRVN